MVCPVDKILFPKSLHRFQTHSLKFDVVILHFPLYLLKLSFLMECSHIPGAQSYLGFQFDELHYRGVTFRLDFADILHDSSFPGSFTPCTIHIVFFSIGFCSVTFVLCGEGANREAQTSSFLRQTWDLPWRNYFLQTT